MRGFCPWPFFGGLKLKHSGPKLDLAIFRNGLLTKDDECVTMRMCYSAFDLHCLAHECVKAKIIALQADHCIDASVV